MRKQLGGIVPLNHHSTADWDFQSLNWELSTAHFISSPAAFNELAGHCRAVLCRIAGAQCLPAGRLVVNTYFDLAEWCFHTFRNQAPLGTATRDDCYTCGVRPGTNACLHVWQSGGAVLLDTWLVQASLNTWEKWRITWWTGVDPTNTPAICVELERYEAGEWISYGILYDTNNRWAESAINRVGLAGLSTRCWRDDTEIWVPA